MGSLCGKGLQERLGWGQPRYSAFQLPLGIAQFLFEARFAPNLHQLAPDAHKLGRPTHGDLGQIAPKDQDGSDQHDGNLGQVQVEEQGQHTGILVAQPGAGDQGAR